MRRIKRATRNILTILVLCLTAFGVGCETPLGPFRATTFPPDLSYLPPEQIRTTMWVLAAELAQIEKLLSEPTGSQPADLQDQVGQSLARMRVAARAIDQAGRTTQHPVLNNNIDRFLTRLDRAKRDTEHAPPNYFRASTIAGSCYLCHGHSQSASSEPMSPTDISG